MATPGLEASDPRLKQAASAVAEYGNVSAAARALGIPRATLQHRYQAWKQFNDAPEGQKAAIEVSGTHGTAKHGWRVVQHEDGSRDSVFWKADDGEDNPEALADAIREALEGITAPPEPEKPVAPQSLCAVFPVADLHMGLLTDAEEVGEDWDSKKALSTFQSTFTRLVDITPSGDVAILAQLGDLLHVDDQRNVTPQHGHQLDADTRYFMILRRAVEAMKWAIETLRSQYGEVVYRGARGNHDMHAHYAVTLALAEYYRDCADVEIIESAQDIFAWEYGITMLVLHHGDKAKPERLAPMIPSQWREMWSRTEDCLVLSGHVHHQKAQEIGGIMFESVGTIIPRDAHAFSHGYTAKRSLVSIVLDREAGEVSRARVKV